MFDGNFLHILLGAGALYITDMALAPMFGGSELNRWIRLFVQAWILKLVYVNFSDGKSTGINFGYGGVSPSTLHS